MKIKEIKKDARKTLKNHYFRSLVIVFIAAIIINGGYNFMTSKVKPSTRGEITETLESINIKKNSKKENFEILEDLINNIQQNAIEQNNNQSKISKYNRGVFAVFFNSVTASGNFVFGILNAFNQLIFNNKISAFVLILIGSIISFVYFFCISNVIEVGKKRYFLEHRRYKDAKLDKLLFPYRMKKTIHISWILLVKKIYLFLWNLTIIGGIIKRYSYAMIPYILAENPNINKKEAFKISREMMNHHKWEMFLMDFSLIGWYILGAITATLSNIFFFNIYRESIYAEYYMYVRKDAKQRSIANIELLCDKYLEGEVVTGTYPDDEYFISPKVRRKWLNIDYQKDYSITTYILFFFTFSIIGWIWEVSLHLFTEGAFINRGTMFGPWLPIYGTGGVAILALLKPIREHPWKLFLFAVVLCGIIEYSTAWYLETFKGMKWWDYSGYFLNLHGRICAEGLLVFGLGGCGFTYIIAPLLNNIYEKIPKRTTIIICAILLILFGIDGIYSHFHPNTGKGITDYASNIEININRLI